MVKVLLLLLPLGVAVAGGVQPAEKDADTLCLVPFDEVTEDGHVEDLAGFTEGFRFEPADVPTALAESRDGLGQAFAGGAMGVVCLAELPAGWDLATRPELTFECQVQPDLAVSRPSYLFAIGPKGSPGIVLGVYLSGPAEVRIVRYAEGEWRDDGIALSEEVPALTWTQFALVLRSGEDAAGQWTARVFLNGREAGRSILTHGPGGITPDAVVQIGSNGTSESAFAGLLDDFRISAIAREP